LISYKKGEIQQLNISEEFADLENIIAEHILQYTILELLSKKSLLSKKDIFNIIKTKSGNLLGHSKVNNSLDVLWFEEMICTEYSCGKCVFSLTEKGRRALNVYKVGRKEAIRFIHALL
jgi:hypothetical protein